MIDLKEKYSHLPTIMGYEDQIMTMKELISIGAQTLTQDIEGAMFVIRGLEISHGDSGVFEFKEEDKVIFLEFIEMLREIGRVAPERKNYFEGMINTFKAFGFSMP